MRDEIFEGVERVELWQKELKPGSYFCSIDVVQETVLYGVVLRPPTDLEDKLADEMLWTRVFGGGSKKGSVGVAYKTDLDFPLTRKQFSVLRKLRWPRDRRVLFSLIGVTRQAASS